MSSPAITPMYGDEHFQQYLKVTSAAPALANAALLAAKGCTNTYLQVLTQLYNTNHLPMPDFSDLNTEIPATSQGIDQQSIITSSMSYRDTAEFTSLDDEIKAFNDNFYHITLSSPESWRYEYQFQNQNTSSLEEELQAFNENYLMMTTSSPDDWEDWFDEKDSSSFSMPSMKSGSLISSYEWLDTTLVSRADSTTCQMVHFKPTLEVYEPKQYTSSSDCSSTSVYSSRKYITKRPSKKAKNTKRTKAPFTSTPFVQGSVQSIRSRTRSSRGSAPIRRAVSRSTLTHPLTMVTPPTSSSSSSSLSAPSLSPLSRTSERSIASSITSKTSSNTWIVVPTPSPICESGTMVDPGSGLNNVGIRRKFGSNMLVCSQSKFMSPITSSSLTWKRCRTQLF